jgi:hypothetical protein
MRVRPTWLPTTWWSLAVRGWAPLNLANKNLLTCVCFCRCGVLCFVLSFFHFWCVFLLCFHPYFFPFPRFPSFVSFLIFIFLFFLSCNFSFSLFVSFFHSFVLLCVLDSSFIPSFLSSFASFFVLSLEALFKRWDMEKAQKETFPWSKLINIFVELTDIWLRQEGSWRIFKKLRELRLILWNESKVKVIGFFCSFSDIT